LGRRNYETLNAMRGLAAVAVVFFHSDELLSAQIAPGGYLAVDIFFVLSGFVIAHAYEDRLKGGLSLGRFTLARMIRFYPLLLLAIAMGVLRAAAGLITNSPTALSPAEIAVSAFTSLFLVPAPVTGSGNLFVLNVPLWTLCFELTINIVYAAIVRHLSNGRLVGAAIAGAALMIWFAIQSGHNDNGAVLATALGGVGRALFGFSVGVLLYRRRALLNVGVVIPLVLVAVLLCIPIPAQLRVAFDLGFALLAGPLLITAGSSCEPSARLTAFATYFGSLSFPIYAIHQPLVGMAGTAAERLSLPSFAVGGLLILCLLVISPLLDRYYDQPLRKWLQRTTNPGVPAPAESAP
jgi:peptidoglycan/LPS O-acetylase OafA/YrhL